MVSFIHYFLHFVFPVMIAYIFYKQRWLRIAIIFLSTMLIDLDHLLATPIYEPCRCSIGFHLLHSYVAIGLYVAFLIHPKSRILGIGLLLHIVADSVDCYLMKFNC